MLKTLFKTVLKALLIGAMLSSCGSSQKVTCGLSQLETAIVSSVDSTDVSIPFADSITNIVCHPQKIVCKLGSQNPVDTVRNDTVKVLAKKLFPVFDFIFLHPNNFKTNEIVYGNFVPTAIYEIQRNRKQQITLQFDFGLKKWKALDKRGQVLSGGDLNGSNLELLRFTRMLFPNDKSLQLMDNNLRLFQK